MKKLFVIFALIFFCTSSWGFTGKIVDNHGRPVAKAKISLWTFWTSPRTFHADEKGEFLFSRNVASDGTVYTTMNKIVDSKGKPIPKAIIVVPWSNDAPFRLQTTSKGQFTFQIPGTWDGIYRVMDKSGAPVPRAKILRSWGPGIQWTDEKVTNDKGEYKIDDWKPSHREKKEFSVNVIADGYSYASLTLDADKELQAVIKLMPERKFKARIMDENGAPVRGAKVVLDEIYGKMKDGGRLYLAGFDIPSTVVKSGKDGYFILRHLPDDKAMESADIMLTIDAPGRARIERRMYKLADLRNGKITLPRACTVQGALRPPAGGKMFDDLGLEIQLKESGDSASESERYIGVDKDGKFRFDNLPPGEATIVLSTTRRRTLGWVLPAVQHLKLTPGEIKNLDLTGVTGAVISGTVRDKATGKPIPNAALTIEDSAFPQGNWWMSEDDGTYSIRVAPGKVKVYMSFIYVGDTRVDFDPKDGITAEVSDGQDQTGLDLSISLPAK